MAKINERLHQLKNGTSVTFRNAMPEDAPILAEAEREIAKTPGRLASSPNELKDEHFREKIIALSSIETGLYVVIEEDGAIVGHAVLDPHKLASTAHVVSLTIAIHEGHQGKGLGKKLMQYLIEWTKNHPKIEKFELQVRSSNTRAINLYKSLGFAEEGRKTKRLKYGPNEYLDDVYMALWVG
jgi:RimJ/RimL family protein N-acetyltransferase